jgi:hypothetical protein
MSVSTEPVGRITNIHFSPPPPEPCCNPRWVYEKKLVIISIFGRLARRICGGADEVNYELAQAFELGVVADANAYKWP